jgi:molybdopterin converting factor small subunit
MKITVSIFLPLPDNRKIRHYPLTVSDEITVGEVADSFGIDDSRVWLYVVNHHRVLERYEPLSEGDHLMVFPPMEGG